MKLTGIFLSLPPPPAHQRRCKNSRPSANRRAETILEVIIAVAVIMVILAPASALYISSMRNTAADRNELVAAVLAEEGIEIARNIRDTNFIKFSDKALDCWNTKPQPDPAQGGCDAAANKIAVGSYRLNVDPATLQWNFIGPVAIDGEEALSGDLSGIHDADYRLYLDASANPECASPGDPPGCHAHFANDTHLYYHAAGAAGANESPFYREIVLQYAANGEALSVASKVLFRSGTIVKTVSRNAILTREPL